MSTIKQRQLGYYFFSRLKQRFIWFTSRPYWHNSRSKCSISGLISKTRYIIWKTRVKQSLPVSYTDACWFPVIRLQQQRKRIYSGVITKKKPIQRWNQFKTNYKFFKIIVKVQKSFTQLVKYWGVYWDYVNRYQWNDRRFKSVGQSTSSHVRQRHA